MPNPLEHPVIAHAMKVRQQMLARDAKTLNTLTKEYLKAYRSLKADVQALQKMIAQVQPEKGDLLRLAATQNLLDGVKREIGKFAAILGDEIEMAIKAEIKQAGLDAFGLVQAALPGMDPAELAVSWSRIAPEQIYTMYGFTDPGGPLYANIKANFSDDVAAAVRESLLQGYIKGMHSTAIAGLIRQATGQGLEWALSTARTATVWSYRAANAANYLANSQVVKGWVWWSALNERTCMSCISLHGTEHSLNEMLADHHLGRCTAIPITKTFAELGIEGVPESPLNIQRGEDWFKAQSAEMQRKMMGPAKYKAWKDGAFEFDQLTRPYISPVYGKMLREASLLEILGANAELYY